MVEIYNLGPQAHERYAKDREQVEAFQQQFHLPITLKVADQTAILTIVPTQTALDALMQTHQRKRWAGFMLPPNYNQQRFSSSYVAPSLGSKEKQDADIHRLIAYFKQQTNHLFSREEEERGGLSLEGSQLRQEIKTILNLLEQGVQESNAQIDYIIGRIYQFIQA